jgi:signal transduction histidine kinase
MSRSRTPGAELIHLNMDRIFKPLFSTKARGMGMGLSICRSIIESHYGRIWASAGASRGSIFQFELPSEASLQTYKACILAGT